MLVRPQARCFAWLWRISEGSGLNMLAARHHKHTHTHTQSKMRSSTALLAVMAFLTHGESYGSVTLLIFLWLHSDPSCWFGLYSVLILLYFLPSLLLMFSRLMFYWTLSHVGSKGSSSASCFRVVCQFISDTTWQIQDCQPGGDCVHQCHGELRYWCWPQLVHPETWRSSQTSDILFSHPQFRDFSSVQRQ